MNLFAPLGPWAFGHLRPHAYNLIVADPPWRFEAYSEKGEAKGAAAQYRCVEVEDVPRLFPLGQLAEPSCLALIWITWPLIDRQIAAMKACGFAYRSMIVWRKVFPSGKIAMGPGYRVRSMTEGVAAMVAGEPEHDPFPGIFDGVRREHSRKPEEFYEIVRRCCPRLTRRADVFTRESRPGFEGWGDEATKFDGVAA